MKKFYRELAIFLWDNNYEHGHELIQEVKVDENLTLEKYVITHGLSSLLLAFNDLEYVQCLHQINERITNWDKYEEELENFIIEIVSKYDYYEIYN